MPRQAPSQVVMTVGDNIRAARGERSRREVAVALGVDQMAIYRWETGRVRPSAANLAALAEYFDRDPGWFYTADHERSVVA